MPSLKNLVVAAAVIAAPLALAKTVTVTATEDNTFDPSSVKAAEGDTVEFRFEKGNHSVVVGNYDWPCSPMQLGSGFFSGFVHTDDGTAVCNRVEEGEGEEVTRNDIPMAQN